MSKIQTPIAFSDRQPTAADLPFWAYNVVSDYGPYWYQWITRPPDEPWNYSHWLKSDTKPTQTPAELLAAAPYTPKVGDRVKLVSTSWGDHDGNPVWGGTQGRVGGSVVESRCCFGFVATVKWDNGCRNSYKAGELALLDVAPEAHTPPTLDDPRWVKFGTRKPAPADFPLWTDTTSCMPSGCLTYHPSDPDPDSCWIVDARWLSVAAPAKVFTRPNTNLTQPVEILSGYRELNDGELIEESDMYCKGGAWKARWSDTFAALSVGARYGDHCFPTIREVEAAKPKPLWRRMNSTEKVNEGDRYIWDYEGAQTFDLYADGSKNGYLSSNWRTPMEGKQAEGCVYFRRLDNEPAVVETAKPQPECPEGTPPYGYRFLVEGETVQAGDRVFGNFGWEEDPNIERSIDARRYVGRVVGQCGTDNDFVFPFVRPLVEEVRGEGPKICVSTDRKDREITQLRSQVAALQLKNDRQRRANAELERANDELRDDNQHFQEVIELNSRNYENALGEKDRLLCACHNREHRAEEELEESARRYAKVSTELADLRERCDFLKADRDQAETALQEAQEKLRKSLAFQYDTHPEHEHVLVTTEEPSGCGTQFRLKRFVPQQKLNDANATITNLRSQYDQIVALLDEHYPEDNDCAQFFSAPARVKVAFLSAKARKVALEQARQRIAKFEQHQVQWHNLWNIAREVQSFLGGVGCLDYVDREKGEASYMAYWRLKQALESCTVEKAPSLSAVEPGVYQMSEDTDRSPAARAILQIESELADAQQELKDLKEQLRNVFNPTGIPADDPVWAVKKLVSWWQTQRGNVEYSQQELSSFKLLLKAALVDWSKYPIITEDKDLIEITADVVNECETLRTLNENQAQGFASLQQVIGSPYDEIEPLVEKARALMLLREAAQAYLDGYSFIGEMNLRGALNRCTEVNPKVEPFTPEEKVAA